MLMDEHECAELFGTAIGMGNWEKKLGNGELRLGLGYYVINYDRDHRVQYRTAIPFSTRVNITRVTTR